MRGLILLFCLVSLCACGAKVVVRGEDGTVRELPAAA